MTGGTDLDLMLMKKILNVGIRAFPLGDKTLVFYLVWFDIASVPGMKGFWSDTKQLIFI